MSDRHFMHELHINNSLAWDGVIRLTTNQIAEAAIQEIIQLSLSASPFDLFLEELLNPATGWFEWIGSLGQIRETKTALSGLFGRFIARAYLTEVWGYEHFHPLHMNVTPLAQSPIMAAVQTDPGDLPDWLIAPDATSSYMYIAEAKGSHDISGPWSRLRAAKRQAERVSLFRGIDKLITKRFAIATRWAVHGHPKLTKPWIVVDDPDDGDVTPTDADYRRMRRGIALGHYAALARGFRLREIEHALLTAMGRPPGMMELPQNELVGVERDGEQLWLAAGLFAGSAIMPIPPRVEALDLNNLAEAFGGQAMLVGVSGAQLIAADRIGLSDSDASHFDGDAFVHERQTHFYARQHKQMALNDGYEPEGRSSQEFRARFWTERRFAAGGFEFVPLKGLRLRRLQLKM